MCSHGCLIKHNTWWTGRSVLCEWVNFYANIISYNIAGSDHILQNKLCWIYICLHKLFGLCSKEMKGYSSELTVCRDHGIRFHFRDPFNCYLSFRNTANRNYGRIRIRYVGKRDLFLKNSKNAIKCHELWNFLYILGYQWIIQLHYTI